MPDDVREAAHAAYAAGLCVVPPRADGSKAPIGRWKSYMTTRPTQVDMDGWYGDEPGVGLVCGLVSGGLEMLEFEGRAVAEDIHKRFRALADQAGLKEVLDRVVTGYHETTPTGGIHLLYRVPQPRPNTKLASRPVGDTSLDVDSRTEVLIETRGQGGYVIVAPSGGTVHPSGKAWELTQGGFGAIAEITDDERDALWTCARLLGDVVPEPVAAVPGWPATVDADSPIARYNGRPDADRITEALLVGHGWSVVARIGRETHLLRPGKSIGISATLGHYPGTFICFSTSTPFESMLANGRYRGYDHAGVLAVLEHGGDMAAMGRALAAAEGPRPVVDATRTLRVLHEERPPADEDADTAGVDPEPASDGIWTRLGLRVIPDIPSDPPPPLLLGRLHESGHTMLFGDGDTGKGALACAWIIGLVRAGHRVLIVDYEGHPDEWSSRLHGLARRGEDLSMVAHVAPLAAAWQGTRGPIWDHIDELRAAIEATGATYLIVDSAVPACFGHDSLKPETAVLYGTAIGQLERPALTLAHATKSGEDRWPFGSIFWHNLSRVTWSAKKLGGPGHRVLLKQRKHNQSAGVSRILAVIDWVDDLPRDVTEESYVVSLSDQIADMLAADISKHGGPVLLSTAEIVERLNDEQDEDDPPVKANSVNRALQRGLKDPKRFTVDGAGKSARWGLAA